MLFKEVIGQDQVRKKLIQSVRENRISHAQMLYGPSGSGKLALAIAYAQYISCENRSEEDSCNECPSCIKYKILAHPDLHFVYPVMTTGKVVKSPVSDLFIETWRESVSTNPYMSENQWYEAIGAENKQGYISRDESKEIVRKLGFKAYESEYKTMIIWLPEKMHPAAANALLKLIEEPPQKTLFILISENTDQVLPTILSRTQLILVPPLKSSEIRSGLKESGAENHDLLDDAVRKANGNFNMALTVLEEDEQELRHFELFTSLMRLCYSRNIVGINRWVEEISSEGRERQKRFLEYSLRLVRENFILNLKSEELSFLSAREEEFSQKFSDFIHRENVEELSEELSLAHSHIEANGYPRTIFLDLAIKITRVLNQKQGVS